MKGEEEQQIESTKLQLIDSIKREINPDLLCQICYENRVNIVITPCGHTFCDKCLGNSLVCYSCRGNIEKSTRFSLITFL